MTDLQICRDLMLTAEKERDEARYQISRTIAQLEGAQTLEDKGTVFVKWDVVDSVIAQLRAYEGSVE